MRPGGRADHPIELLSASIDRELKPAESAALEAHLEGCAECRGLLKDFRRLDEAMVSEPPPPVPAGLEARILASLPARGPVGAPRPFWRQAMPLAAAASIAMAVLLWLGGSHRLPPLSGTLPASVADRTSVPAEPKGAETADASARPSGPAATAPPPAPSAPAVASNQPSAAAPPARGRAFAHGAPSPRPVDQPQAGTVPNAAVGAEIGKQDALQRVAAAPPSANEESRSKAAAADESWKVESAPLQEQAAARQAAEQARHQEANALQAAPRIAAAGPPGGATPAAVQVPPPVGLFASPYVVMIEMDGRMQVHRGAYNCTVPIEEDDRKVVDAALEEIVGRSDVGSAGAVVRPDVRDAGGARVVTATPRGREAVLRLVRERYRVLLETRCGPLPG